MVKPKSCIYYPTGQGDYPYLNKDNQCVRGGSKNCYK